LTETKGFLYNQAMIDVEGVKERLRATEIDPFWAFADKTRKDTAYITHGYHRYPAKFIPQVVSNLVERYTKKGDLVVDPMCGSGTAIVESKVMGRSSVGVDINPVAVLIAKAKTQPLEPTRLSSAFDSLKANIDAYTDDSEVVTPKHERIDYWFKEKEKRELSIIFQEISRIENQGYRNFFSCGFSNILKNCSIWLQKSNKPTRDFKKIPSAPIPTFYRQIKTMVNKNEQFYALMSQKNYLDIGCKIECRDARSLPVGDNSVSLIVTSPPYVTSYEYADLHQLSALWFQFTDNLNNFRKNFIGTTAGHEKENLFLNSSIAKATKEQLYLIDKKTSEEVAAYFCEMNQVFSEMKRVLRKKGKACVVIGNTNLKGVEILNAEVFVDQMQNWGFAISDIIKREIPSKNLPSTRDIKTGKFTKLTNENKTEVYPTEYILVMENL
jgi:DNA modification methylase